MEKVIYKNKPKNQISGCHQTSQKQHRKKIKSEKNFKNQGRKKMNQQFYTQSRVQMSYKNPV